MALENGDIIFASNSPPYAAYTEGVARVPQALQAVNQTGAWCCAMSADGSMIAFGHTAGTLLDVIDVASGNRISAASFTTGGINGLAFSPDGTKLAIAHSTTPFVTILNTSTWAALSNPATLPASTGWGVAWSPDGSKLAVAHSTSPFMTVYNTSDWSKMANPASLPTDIGNAVAFSPDNSKIALAMASAPWIRVFNASDLSNASVVPSVSSAGSANTIAYSPDGTRLAVGITSAPYLKIYNTADGSEQSVPTLGGQVYSVSWVHDDELLIGSSAQPKLTVWKPSAGTTKTLTFIGNICTGVAAKKYTPKTISGSIKDINDNGVLRTVRAYRRSTGELVGESTSNAATGLYSISCRYFDEHEVIMLDDAAGSIENDQILRTTPV